MNNTTLLKVRRFGKIGALVSLILFAAALLLAAAVTVGTVWLAALPGDGVTVSMTGSAEIRVGSESFPGLWSILADSVAYAADGGPGDAQSEAYKPFLPPEDQEIRVGLSLFSSDFTSAVIRTQGDQKVIDAVTDPSVYRLNDLILVLAAGIVFLLSAAAALWLLRALFRALAADGSPFSEAVVRKMRAFSFALIPVAVFSSAGETLATAFLSAGRDGGICIQWGVAAAFLITLCLATVFRYGVQLQRESDETL